MPEYHTWPALHFHGECIPHLLSQALAGSPMIHHETFRLLKKPLVIPTRKSEEKLVKHRECSCMWRLTLHDLCRNVLECGRGFGSPPAPRKARVRLPQSSQQLELRLVLRNLSTFKSIRQEMQQCIIMPKNICDHVCVRVSMCSPPRINQFSKNMCLLSSILCCLTQ